MIRINSSYEQTKIMRTSLGAWKKHKKQNKKKTRPSRKS